MSIRLLRIFVENYGFSKYFYKIKEFEISNSLRYYIISKCLRASLIASIISVVGCERRRFNYSTAFGASYIGKPKSRLTSAIYAV